MELNGVPATLDQIKSLALTNYGHFTSMHVEDQRVRGLSLHMQRFARTAGSCSMLISTSTVSAPISGMRLPTTPVNRPWFE